MPGMRQEEFEMEHSAAETAKAENWKMERDAVGDGRESNKDEINQNCLFSVKVLSALSAF
jgi:hypothetical protein